MGGGTPPVVYNPYDRKQVASVWSLPQRAIKVSEYYQQQTDKGLKVEKFVNISDDDRIILINPGETILAHTQEFIGG